ncbi:MAG: hypothetical protein LW892_02265 [Betaproteobacteria bacterium]|jgi:hypothetical protein|nr:hypothetical protein [Betaproteobacteria bacterium]
MRKYLLLLTFLLCSGAVWAQRQLPAEGRRAEVGSQQPLPVVQLGNDLLRLAPGAIIFDTANRRITHGQLPPGADVLYQLDRNGEVLRMFILTPLEQARLDQSRK